QVNDLGPGGINAPPRSQVAYAWYAFDTTNNAPVNTASLIGGSGLIEGDPNLAGLDGYDRGVAGTGYWGDLLYFNTDGSLGSMGAVENIGAQQTAPHLYLSPLQPAINPGVSPIPVIGAEVLDVTVNFGTAGMLTFGRRDGMFADAQGTYQVVNGVNTYVPNSTAFMKSQDGYTDGTLQGVQFDKTGTILGTFSNGQTTALGQVVMALPDNPEGMSKIGSNYFAPSPNAGPIFVGLPGQNGTNLGTIQGDSLEGSNVDLTVELSNMIIAQRGFGVNSRVIAVENSNLQVLTQLGQGG
ncbi:MAG TPA: flagellar hook-basal body complex protein, partial [bacterium]